ncbi:MAG TPA: AMP-binding protein [Alphaproteobacteria bacterium]|nr:AMP-binding protein [Alphaproteobacteria bacterium]
MNVAQLLLRAGRSARNRPAVASGTRALWDYRALAERSARLAGGMLASGLGPGDRVALVMRNCPDYVALLFAGWWAGLTVVPVNAKLHAKEVAYILEHSGAKLAFATPDPGCPGNNVVEIGGTEYGRMLAAEPAPPAGAAPDDVAWLFYTSGTTGQPKGAMLTHRNLLAMTLCYFADVDRISGADAILHAAPMSHGSGLYILPHVAAAAVNVVPESGGFDPAEIANLIAAWPGTGLFAAPTMVSRLVAHPAVAGADLSNLKTIIYGGGPMYLADCRRALDVLGNRLVQIYGQGESPMTITALSRNRHADFDHPRYLERLASVGVAQSAVEVAVMDADGGALPPGEAGEVCVRGETVMKGYWRDEAATAEALRGGWLRTGDMGTFDADGFLTLKDRSKDLIISGGSNVYPREVEEVLLTHPGLREAAVVGMPDPDWGEVVVAFIVPDPAKPVPETELDRLCLDRIARFKRPKRYIAVDRLPKNNYGKVLKTELRRWLAEG